MYDVPAFALLRLHISRAVEKHDNDWCLHLNYDNYNILCLSSSYGANETSKHFVWNECSRKHLHNTVAAQKDWCAKAHRERRELFSRRKHSNFKVNTLQPAEFSFVALILSESRSTFRYPFGCLLVSAKSSPIKMLTNSNISSWGFSIIIIDLRFHNCRLITASIDCVTDRNLVYVPPFMIFWNWFQSAQKWQRYFRIFHTIPSPKYV